MDANAIKSLEPRLATFLEPFGDCFGKTSEQIARPHHPRL